MGVPNRRVALELISSADLSNQDISTELQALSYTSTDSNECIARVQLGKSGDAIAGNGDYYAKIFINDIEVLPRQAITVPDGVTLGLLASRKFVLDKTDTLKIKITGLAGDSSVGLIVKVYARKT